jgi:hypothetical protein
MPVQFGDQVVGELDAHREAALDRLAEFLTR